MLTIYTYIQELFTERLPFVPSNVKASLFIILFCIIAFTELYIYIGTRRIKQWFEGKRNKKYKEIITNMLANIVVYDDDAESDEIIAHFTPEFKKLPLKNSAVREILIKELLHYHLNFTGKTADVLKGLYLQLKLNKYSKRKLNGRWETQIEGIREITQMWLKEEAETILKFTDDENSQVRMEAQASFVKLSMDNPFRFLDRARERILDWHQLILFEVITKTKNVEIPSFSPWLSSKNDTVIMLCLKLINHYQQLDAMPELIRLLQHANLHIRAKTINILGCIEAEMTEENLFEMYFDQPLEIKLEIIKAMGKIGSGNYLEFLTGRTYSENFKIRMEAMYSIKLHGITGIELLENIYKDTNMQNQVIIKHVLDERIVA
ncbi:MAG TPA: HEAT repeat domain-containing protein [Sphingobacteriaceae bacterium]|nr:HEAT repeat domain-containing protein [Sphingobacteriaceae bacterium]